MLAQDDQKEIQHDFSVIFTLLALASASCDVNAIVQSTIVLISLKTTETK